MTNDYILYQKFTDLESAEQFSEELINAGIPCRLQNNNHSYMNIYGTAPVDFLIGVNIKQNDFKKADLVLEAFYKSQIENIDKSYHLFSYSNEELEEIIYGSLEHGRLDVLLARNILKENGVSFSEELIEQKKKEQILLLKSIEPVSKIKLAVAYILCVVMPLASFFIGFLIVNSANILPDGSRFYTRSEGDRRHGKIIIGLSFIFSFFYIADMLITKYA